MKENGEDGFPKHLPFDYVKEMEWMVCNKCLEIFETYTIAMDEGERSLQSYIQPSTIHVSIVKDASSPDGVAATITGEDVRNSYPWETYRIAQALEEKHNSYSFGLAPARIEELEASTTVERFNANGIFLTSNATKPTILMGQVTTTTGRTFFLKLRLDFMVPEFDREISVLRKIVECGLHKRLRVSPFVGLVVLGNGQVAGMVFEWLQGRLLVEQDLEAMRKFGRVWREEVEGIVRELHRCGVVWEEVNTHNIFIDGDEAAWVIDFGGNCNVEFVDKGMKETEEGGWQGIQRIFEE